MSRVLCGDAAWSRPMAFVPQPYIWRTAESRPSGTSTPPNRRRSSTSAMPSSVPASSIPTCTSTSRAATDWEGFSFATRAAVAGGVTTLVDMPLNSVPPTTTVQALEDKRDAARSQCSVDVGFLGGVVPGNAQRAQRRSSMPASSDSRRSCASRASASSRPFRSPTSTRRCRCSPKSDALLMVHAEEPSLLLPPAARRPGNAIRHLACDPACAGGDEGGRAADRSWPGPTTSGSTWCTFPRPEPRG